MPQQSLTPNANLIANSLTLPSMNSIRRAADISGQYSRLLKVFWMLNYNNPAGMSSISTVDGKRTVSRLKDMTRKQPIAGATLVGTNLQLTFPDPTYDEFRVGAMLIDTNSGVQGMVISAAPGSVILQPVGTAFNTATQFLVGKTVSDLGGVNAKNKMSTSPVGLYDDPTTEYNYTSIVRDAAELSRRDMANETMVKYNEKGWWSAYETQMVNRCFSGVEKRLLVSERFSNGQMNINGGVDWLIANRGGSSLQSPVPATISDINDIIQLIKVANATPTMDIWCFCGQGFLGNLTTLLTSNNRYITNVGRRDTLNGMNVVDFDCQIYKIYGTTVTFMELPILNYGEFWAEQSAYGGLKKSWTAYFMNLAPIPAYGGGTIPAVELFYFNDTPIYYGYVGGTVDINGLPNAGALQAASFQGNVNLAAKNATSDVDGVKAWILAELGVDAVDTKAFVKWEITV